MPTAADVPIILCPLAFERDQLVRAGLGAHGALHVAGPGRERMASWLEAQGDGASPIVLAGLAGGLHSGVKVGAAYVITSVFCSDGKHLTPTFSIDQLPGASISSADQSLTSPAAKRDWHAAHQTDLVDLESETFARAMHDTDRPWAIVRGVSDSVDEALPADIDSWVDEQGRARPMRIAMALLRKPALIPTMRRLGQHSKCAMAAVADVLRHVTDPQ